MTWPARSHFEPREGLRVVMQANAHSASRYTARRLPIKMAKDWSWAKGGGSQSGEVRCTCGAPSRHPHLWFTFPFGNRHFIIIYFFTRSSAAILLSINQGESTFRLSDFWTVQGWVSEPAVLWHINALLSGPLIAILFLTICRVLSNCAQYLRESHRQKFHRFKEMVGSKYRTGSAAFLDAPGCLRGSWTPPHFPLIKKIINIQPTKIESPVFGVKGRRSV